MTPEHKTRLQYLRRLTPKQLDDANAVDELLRLQVQYLVEEHEAHDAFVAKTLADPDVDQALGYNYKQALIEIQQCSIRLPAGHAPLSILRKTLWHVQAWKDWLGQFADIAIRHHRVLDSVCNRIVVDWQCRAMTATEWQAKAEALALHPDLVEARDRAEMFKRLVRGRFERLVGQWETVSRCGTFMDMELRIGDISITLNSE